MPEQPVDSHIAIHPVILSGGSGTRLWPLSQSKRPKQFIPLITDKTMMQDTALRLPAHEGFAEPIIVSSAGHADTVIEQMRDMDMPPSAVFLEPAGRNTAAAITLPALWLLEQQDDALMLVMPSDHVIADVDSFRRAIALALPAAADGQLVVFGIHAAHAETGYGYIAQGAPLPGVPGVYEVAKFVEKPTLAVAETFVADGGYHWNGGIFLLSARSYIEELRQWAPEVLRACTEALSNARRENPLVYPEASAFLSSPDLSIDYAVMEKTQKAVVVPVEMGWSDVGSWEALWAVRDRDENGNCIKGAALTVDAQRNLLYVEDGPPIAALGLEDMIVVSTASGILVMPRSRSQDVKKVVELVKSGHFNASDPAPSL